MADYLFLCERIDAHVAACLEERLGVDATVTTVAAQLVTEGLPGGDDVAALIRDRARALTPGLGGDRGGDRGRNTAKPKAKPKAKKRRGRK